jgi:hypothetical protein
LASWFLWKLGGRVFQASLPASGGFQLIAHHSSLSLCLHLASCFFSL